jgi:predicted phage-related endonuclease
MREDLRKRRQAGLGASDSPIVILGEADVSLGSEVQMRTALDLYCDKVGTLDADTTAPDMERGHYCEAVPILKLQAEFPALRIARPVTEDDRWTFLREHPRLAFLFANLDGLEGERNPIEVKCPRTRKYRDIVRNGLRDSYIVQGQHQLACTGGEVCHFLVFSAELWEYRYFRLERDEALIAEIEDRDGAFWNDHVIARVPPVPAEWIQQAAVIPRKGAELVDCSALPAWQALAEEYRAAAVAADEATRRKKELEGSIQELMEASSVPAVRVGSLSLRIVESAGKRTLNKQLIRSYYPDVDLTKCERVGKASKGLRAYGPGLKGGEDDDD